MAHIIDSLTKNLENCDKEEAKELAKKILEELDKIKK